MTRGLRLAASAAALWTSSVAASSAAPAATAPAPSLGSVVLSTGDFAPGARVAAERSVSLGGLPGFVRVFRAGVKLGGRPLFLAVGVGLLDTDTGSARGDFAQLQQAAQTKAGRQALAKVWGTDFLRGANAGSSHALTVTRTVVGPPVALGPGGLRLPLTISTNLGTLRMAIGIVQVDRVLDIVELAARFDEKIAVGDIARAVSAVRQHLRAAFTVASTAPPTISGTAQQGQTLTVDEGSWTGAPSGFAYAWSRCDSTGSACVAITGATANTYVPGAGDSGGTIRVTVTGSNSVSSQQAVSVQTPPVA